MSTGDGGNLRRIASSEVRANLAGLLREVGDEGERVLIERRGKSSVALVSVDDLLRYQLLEALAGCTPRQPTRSRGAGRSSATARPTRGGGR